MTIWPPDRPGEVPCACGPAAGPAWSRLGAAGAQPASRARPDAPTPARSTSRRVHRRDDRGLPPWLGRGPVLPLSLRFTVVSPSGPPAPAACPRRGRLPASASRHRGSVGGSLVARQGTHVREVVIPRELRL